MKRSILLVSFLLVVGIFALSNTAQPQSATPTILEVTPADVKWMPFTIMGPGAQIAVIYGSAGKPELYVVLVKYPPNFKVLPHFHPVEQVATVLSGTIYAGLGESFEPSKLKMFPTGSVYTEPLKTPHFSETRGDGVVLQVIGIGPGGTQYVNPADDPRKK
jgi:quercetin dioxygenase-like cupin family protein